ncbi:MAG TPA: hypothetical protein VFI60_06815, partial [Candidatus Acidoferrum sp.]|nr:hypothetical protein [Candidatus Acidoferrum sp.]
SVTLTQGVWSNTLNGEITYTCSTNCNVSVNAPINISGFTGNGRFNGNFTIISTPSNTTFVVYSPSTTTPPVTTDTSGGTLKVLACNLLSMPSVSVPNTVEGSSSDTVMRWWVYRNNVLAFVVQQRDPYYEDCGVNIPSANIPSYVPSAPSASSVNKYLATTIVSGGGTTSIVVANAAGNTASGQTALHDNSQNLLAAATASRFGTPVYIPSGPNPPFNAATVFTGANAGDAHIRLAGLAINQPWVVRSGGMVFEGLRNNGTSFAFGQMAVLTGGGSAFPVVLQLPLNNGTVSAGNQQTLTGVNYLNLEFNAPALQQIAFVNDQSFMFGLLMNNVAFVSSTSASNVNIPAAVIKGPTHSAIGSPGNENSCAVTQVVLGPPCIRFTTQSPASVNSVVGILAQTEIDGWNMQGGTSFQFDALPWLNGGGSSSSVTGAFNIRMIKMLGEQRFGPFLRVAGTSPTLVLKQVDDDAPNASIGNGFIDTAFTSNGPASVIAEDIASSVPVQVLVSGPGFVYSRNSSFAPGTTRSSAPPFGGVTTYSGGSFVVSGSGTGIQSFGSSTIGYGMPQPNTPSLNVGAHGSCSTNCVPSGTWFWEIIANDIYGHNTLPSLSATAAVDGTQSVTVSWVPIPGQVSTMRGRGTSLSTVLFADTFGTGVAGNSYVDGNLSYTVSPPNSANANSASLGPSGVTGNQFNYVNSGFTDTISGALTTNRAQTIPDVTGYIPVTSYVNSAYDNATRANGAIGANWTVANNGINIASNNFVGTAGTNDVAYWSASPFSNVQFSQVTLTALNGTTDFPGVAVLLSGSGSSTHGYNCVEDTTTIFIQKINGTSNTTLTSASTTGVAGDILRLEVDPAGNLTCYKNSVSTLTVNDTTYTSGAPGLFLFGTVSTAKNWSGGNLHPLSHLDTEQDWTRTQHFTQGIALGGASAESFNNNPRAEQNVFLPGALTSTWTGATWTTDKPVTITHVQVQAKTAPAGCTTNAVVRLTDGTTPVNVTISAAANDSGAISQNYSAGSSLTVTVQTAASGCTTSPADANVTVQYRMQ